MKTHIIRINQKVLIGHTYCGFEDGVKLDEPADNPGFCKICAKGWNADLRKQEKQRHDQ